MTSSLLAVFAAAVLAWVFGAVWYGVLGRVWPDGVRSRYETGTGSTAPPRAALIISFVAELLMATVLAGLLLYARGAGASGGVALGGLCWLGFVLTTLVTNNAYMHERPLKTAIDASHWLGVLIIQGAVLGALLPRLHP